MKFPTINRSVLLTGCSSGIGAAAAGQLRERGWTVYPTARKEQDLEDLRQQGFDPVALDVADGDSVHRAAREVFERCEGTLGALVNNAGFGQAGALESRRAATAFGILLAATAIRTVAIRRHRMTPA